MGQDLQIALQIQQEQHKFSDLAARILAEAKSQGATDCEVGISKSLGYTVNVRLGQVETVEYHQDQSVGVTIYRGQRKGSAGCTDLSWNEIQAAIKAAAEIAQYGGEDPYAGLADKQLLAWNYPDLDLYHPWKISPEQAIELALNCERAGRDADPRINNSDGASVATGTAVSLYANSLGFTGFMPASYHSISCMLVASDGEGMQRDYDYSSARDAKQLMAPEKIGKEAALRTVRRLNAQRINTCTVPVIFEAPIASSIARHFLSAISGGALYRRATFLLDHLGKQIFPSFVNMHEQPHIRGGIGSSPYDSEGVATRTQHFIQDGVLKSYLLGSYSARKLGMTSTGNASGVHNFVIDSTAGNLQELCKKMDKGLLVTEFLGQGVNTVTGDYSRGANGFWVEHGEIQYPVEQLTIAGNLKEMFANLIAVGNDVDRRGNIHCGSILLDKMTVAGL